MRKQYTNDDYAAIGMKWLCVIVLIVVTGGLLIHAYQTYTAKMKSVIVLTLATIIGIIGLYYLAVGVGYAIVHLPERVEEWTE